jgi:hypothetical protein
MDGRRTFQDIVNEYTIDNIQENNINAYFNLIRNRVRDIVEQSDKPIKFKLVITSEFNTLLAFDIIEAHYQGEIRIIRTMNDFDTVYNYIRDNFETWVDEFQERGSVHVFNQIIKTIVKTYQIRSLRASSYIPTEFKSSNIINVRNKKDNKCFLWAILAKLYPLS